MRRTKRELAEVTAERDKMFADFAAIYEPVGSVLRWAIRHGDRNTLAQNPLTVYRKFVLAYDGSFNVSPNEESGE